MLIGDMLNAYLERLTPLLGPSEASSVAHLVMDEVLRMRRIDIVLRKSEPLSVEHQVHLHELLERLSKHEPVQYVLGKGFFLGKEFKVNRSVLIPRPETEELVLWMLECTAEIPMGKLMDLGTGTGCIPITFADSRPGWDVHAVDISQEALIVARSNAQRMKVKVNFHVGDMTSPALLDDFSATDFDCIVSNPPYIPASDRTSLDSRVKDYEPELALFAPDEDPLRYYRHISAFSRAALTATGCLFLEVHENFAAATADMLTGEGWSEIIVREDIFGKPRMIKASL